MWYFNSPLVVFGEGALDHLSTLEGRRAFIVTDANLQRLGVADEICQALAPTGMRVEIYAEIEPDPSLDAVQRGAEVMSAFAPDWIIALGGGSVMDAAKGMWVLYEHPDLTPDLINPVDAIHLRQKARLVAIPTTAGTGSEATWAIVLTDTVESRKLALGNREDLPDVAILDPRLIAALPPRLTAATGLDALTHAIEGYTTTFHNDFTDGPCLQAARLIFDYLPAAYCDGSDLAAREHTQNAATIAGLGFGNAMAGLAHGLGHALGAVFHIPHGCAVALFLPYTIEYCANDDAMPTRYADLASFLGLPADSPQAAARALVQAVRDLEKQVGQPLTLQECGITRPDLERAIERLVENALNDSQTIMATRVPESADLRRLIQAAWDGSPVDF